jgi:hypothetical protein
MYHGPTIPEINQNIKLLIKSMKFIIIILGVCILLHVRDPGDGGGGRLFRLCNVSIVGYFYYTQLSIIRDNGGDGNQE